MSPHASSGLLAGTAGQDGLVKAFPASVDVQRAPPRSGIERADEPLGEPDRPEFEPTGAGGEASTSSTSDVTLLEFSPDRGQTMLVDEVSVSLESNGKARIALNGVVYGPYTGATDISLQYRGAKLPFGGHIRIKHQSTDGNSTTTKAAITGREV